MSSQADTPILANKYMDMAKQIVRRAQEEGREYSEEKLAPTTEAEKCAAAADACPDQGIPKRIIDTMTSEILETPAMLAISEFLTKPKEAWCIVLAGPKGCGKSTAAGFYLWSKTMSSLASPPKTRRWWTASRLARVSGYNQDFEPLIQVPTMVIDDLGVEYLDKNGYFSHRLDEIIDERYSNYRPTIITTNLNGRDFRARYGDRVIDRIREGFPYGGKYIEINNNSMRINGNER